MIAFVIFVLFSVCFKSGLGQGQWNSSCYHWNQCYKTMVYETTLKTITKSPFYKLIISTSSHPPTNYTHLYILQNATTSNIAHISRSIWKLLLLLRIYASTGSMLWWECVIKYSALCIYILANYCMIILHVLWIWDNCCAEEYIFTQFLHNIKRDNCGFLVAYNLIDCFVVLFVLNMVWK